MNATLPCVTLVNVGDVQCDEHGTAYFRVSFKRGLLSSSVSRTFYGKKRDDGTVYWFRASPDDLRPYVGSDLSAEVSLEEATFEPHEYVSQSTGKVTTIRQQVIVRFADETLEQAIRRCGFTPLGEARPTAPQPTASPFSHPGAPQAPTLLVPPPSPFSARPA